MVCYCKIKEVCSSGNKRFSITYSEVTLFYFTAYQIDITKLMFLQLKASFALLPTYSLKDGTTGIVEARRLI